jgi:hypothetical protein
MSKTDTWEQALLNYAFQGTAIPWNAETALYVSLHTSSPGEAGAQNTNEIAYTGYARVACTRNSSSWSRSNSTISNTVALTFGAMAGGAGGTVTHVGIGTTLSGAGTLLYFATLSTSISVVNGVTPYFSSGDINVAED